MRLLFSCAVFVQLFLSGRNVSLVWLRFHFSKLIDGPFCLPPDGQVVIKEIDGPVVRLELQVRYSLFLSTSATPFFHGLACCSSVPPFLSAQSSCSFILCLFGPQYDVDRRFATTTTAAAKQGACGSCPSSTQTMKMGLERGLREKIPEIQEVIQAMPEGPPLEDDQVNVVLDGVRPFLQVAGGTIGIDRIDGVGGLQPTIWLDMQGSSASLNSVKLEIAQRLQRHFMMPGLHIEWMPVKK